MNALNEGQAFSEVDLCVLQTNLAGAVKTVGRTKVPAQVYAAIFSEAEPVSSRASNTPLSDSLSEKNNPINQKT